MFNYDPEATDFVSGLSNIKFNSSLLGLAVSNKLYPQEQKFLYFRPLASKSLIAVKEKELECFSHEVPIKVEKAINVLPSQSIVHAFSSQNTLFFGMTKENAIGCWNKYQPLNKHTLVRSFDL